MLTCNLAKHKLWPDTSASSVHRLAGLSRHQEPPTFIGFLAYGKSEIGIMKK